MCNLWFKGCYVDPILSGDKTDTVRPIGKRPPPREGELIGLAVGPRPAFAAAIVTAVEEVDAGELDPERRAAVASMCGDASRYRRISFRVLKPPQRESGPSPARRPVAAAR